MPVPTPAVEPPPVLPHLDRPHLDLPGLAEGRLALVGNAPGSEDHAAAIDACEGVVRFNNAAGFGGRTGARVTHLALVNRGGQMREWLDDPGFLDRPAIRQARAFLLPFPALPPAAAGMGDGACWTREALAMLRSRGRLVHVLPEALHAASRRLLASDPVREAAGRPNPSTGFLVALALLSARAPGASPVEAFGFGFSGWPGHPWAAERRWFEQAQASGRLRLHRP